MRFLLFPITKKGCNEYFLKKLKKKRGQKKQIHCDEKKKRIRGVSFVDSTSFKTNKRVILFCKELVSRNMNLNQRKSEILLEAEKHL